MSLLVLLVVALCASAIATPTSYPMVCKGLSSASNTGGFAQLYTYNDGSTVMSYGFRRGTAAYSPYNGNLPAGTCTWLDRDIGAEEPATLQYTVTSSSAYSYCNAFVQSGFQCYSSDPIAAAVIALGNGQANHTFNCYNDGGYRMVITSLVT